MGSRTPFLYCFVSAKRYAGESKKPYPHGTSYSGNDKTALCIGSQVETALLRGAVQMQALKKAVFGVFAEILPV